MVQERQQRGVRPVDVLDDQHEWRPRRDRLEEAPPRRERLLPVRRLRPLRADEDAKPRDEPRPVVAVVDDVGDRCRQLLRDLFRAVGLEDPGVRLHDLAQRPERHAFSVGDAAASAPHDVVAAHGKSATQLGNEPALSDPRLSRNRHELHRLLAQCPRECLCQQREVLLATDERRAVRRLDGPESQRGRAPGRNRLRFPFQRRRFELLVLHSPSRRAVGCLAHNHRADRRRLLQTRSRVDDISGDDDVALVGTRAEVDDHLARVHADAEREREIGALGVELLDRGEDAKRRGNGALGIILVSDRHSEYSHHGVADELLDRAAEMFELRPDALQVRSQRRPDVLGIHLLGSLREPNEVGEEHRDHLSLLASGGASLERRSTRKTEVRERRVVLAATVANRHWVKRTAGAP